MRRALQALRIELGALGIGALALLAGAAAFSLAVLEPLEQRRQRLDLELEAGGRRAPPAGVQRVASPGVDPAAEFYRYFERKERIEDWLAKLYGIATAAGVELRSADYRLSESGRRIERYEIRLPVTGSYAQVRAFLERALLEVPVLSLDQATFRREAVNDARIDAELALTIHVLRR
jgi:hypothetical protein